MRKHRLAVGVVAAFVGIVTLSAIALGYLYREQRHAYQVAERRRIDAEWRGYVASIMAAHGALEANDVPTCMRWLEQAPAALRNWEWRYLAARADVSAATLGGHADPVRAIAFAPDGAWFLSTAEDRMLRVWDSQFRELRSTSGLFAQLGTVAISPDAARIAAVTIDYRLNVLDAATLDPILRVGSDDDNFSAVAFSPDGKLLATGEFRAGARIWNSENGRELFSLDGPTRVTFVAFHPDGRRLAVGYEGTGLVIWDLDNRAARTTIGRPRAVLSAAFSPDGSRIAIAQDETGAGVWDVATGAEVLELRADAGGVISLAWDPDGHHVATGLRDRTVRLWNASTGELMRTLRGHLGRVYDVAFTPDGRRVISASRDHTLKVWDLGAAEDVTELRGHRHWVTDVAFSPDSRRVATCSRDSTVRVWDALTGAQLQSLTTHDEGVPSVAFSSDGRRVVSGSRGKGVVISDVESGEVLLTLTDHDTAQSVTVSGDGRLIAAGGRDRVIRLWDAHNGAEVQQLDGHAALITRVAFSPRGDRLVSSANDGTARIWTLDLAPTPTASRPAPACIVLKGHNPNVADAIFDHTGEHVITSSPGAVRFWRAADGELVRTLTVDSAPVGALARTPDGARLAMVVDDGVKLIDMATGDEVLTLRGLASAVTQVAFSPDGQRLAAGSWDHTARVWHAPAAPR